MRKVEDVPKVEVIVVVEVEDDLKLEFCGKKRRRRVGRGWEMEDYIFAGPGACRRVLVLMVYGIR
jgi:hypothetical protein